jgi:DNA invertase Pin-like site-specific DNA recombinase
MQRIGYVRVSSLGQNLDRQDLHNRVDKLFEEKASAGSRDRPQLEAMMEHCREGDLVSVHSIDRLARNLQDLQAIIKELTDKGVTIEFLKENLTFNPKGQDIFGTLQLQIIGAVAEFERAISAQRREEGVAKAKAKDALLPSGSPKRIYKGTDKKINRKQLHVLIEQGLSKTKVAETLGISRMSVHRILKEEE